jgi:hypothetical protein
LPDDHLLAVASDSGLELVSGLGSTAELLSLVRAKEIAQAALAQAQVKLAEQKAAVDDALVEAAQPVDLGPSVVQSPVVAASPEPLQSSIEPRIPAPKISRAKLPSCQSRCAFGRYKKLWLNKHESLSGCPNESVHLEHSRVWAQRPLKPA